MPSKDGTATQILSSESNPAPCLLNINEDCTQPRFHNKNKILGTSYMRKVGNSKFMIIEFGETRSWWSMNTKELPAYTYYEDDPSTKFKGYGVDIGSQSGCQESLVDGWVAFGHSNGNSRCKANLFISMFYVMKVYQKENFGASITGNGHNQYGFLYVR